MKMKHLKRILIILLKKKLANWRPTTKTNTIGTFCDVILFIEFLVLTTTPRLPGRPGWPRKPTFPY